MFEAHDNVHGNPYSSDGRLGAPPPWLQLDESLHGDGTLRLTLGDELDIATAPAVRERLRGLRLGRTPTTLDLSRISFIDCCGLRVILEALEAADHDGWRLEILPEFSTPLQRLLALIDSAGVAHRLRDLGRLAGASAKR